MLTAIDHDTLSWECLVYDENGDLSSCGAIKHALINETCYLASEVGRGAVIALPACGCGAQMFLKADYTNKDVQACSVDVQNDAGQTWARVMRLGHVRNLLTHWMLYERGMTDHAPLLVLPPQNSRIEGIPEEVVAAIWFAQQTKTAMRQLHLQA